MPHAISFLILSEETKMTNEQNGIITDTGNKHTSWNEDKLSSFR
jgi:hypothetical protein